MKNFIILAIMSLLSSNLYASQVKCDLFSSIDATAENKIASWKSQRGVSGAIFSSRTDKNDFIFASFKPVLKREKFEISLMRSGGKDQPNILVEFAETKVINGQIDLTVFLKTADTLVHCYSIF